MSLNSFDAHQLRADLQPLDLPQPASGEAAQHYLQLYGLDVADKNIIHSMGYLTFHGYRLATHVWCQQSSKGSILLCHGYFDHVGLYQKLIKYLLKNGYDVIAFDLPGHGISSGEQAAITSFDQYQDILKSYINWMDGRLSKPWYGIGQSTGGAILNHYVLQCGIDKINPVFKKLVVLAPLVRPFAWRWGEFLFWAGQRITSTIPRKFAPNSNNLAFNYFLQFQDPLQSRTLSVQWVGAMRNWMKKFITMPSVELPVLVIQGTKDKTIDWRWGTKVLKEKFINAEFYFIEKAQHQLVNEKKLTQEKIFKKIIEFLS